jgi:hypothetical protein
MGKIDCAGTVCNGGCCPILDAWCCDNPFYCTSTEDGIDCPSQVTQPKFAQILKVKADCSGKECPSGCCPLENDNAVCCPDSVYCADFISECPKPMFQ